MLLVSGDLARRTGGNLYDQRMERACRRAGVSLRIISAGSTAHARAELARLGPRVVVIDSIAIRIAAPLLGWMRAELRARVVALMHMQTRTRGTREVLRVADRVIAVSPALARALSGTGVLRARPTVIPPGTDGIPRVSRGAGRSRDRGRLRVLAVANWSPAKGIAQLVAAASDVPAVHLDLVGDTGSGAYRDAVLARIRSNAPGARVVVHGSLGERALARRYAEADVFALPTEREGYGIVFAEALAHGLPIIAADIASVRAIVGSAGLFVPPRRTRPLAAALRLMTDAWLRRRLANAARGRARALPRWSTSEALFVALVGSEMRAPVGDP
ncbi:MAG TPA: glycosyltransferase family 4 protein [Candidatus Limnocylindria bacterium]|nr:glycosyltransferase family 4 protein [Candidatus Limnocylindria bacterium]